MGSTQLFSLSEKVCLKRLPVVRVNVKLNHVDTQTETMTQKRMKAANICKVLTLSENGKFCATRNPLIQSRCQKFISLTRQGNEKNSAFFFY